MSTDYSDKITVLMLLQAMPPMRVGGAEVQALRLGEKLTQKNVKVIYVCPGLKGSIPKQLVGGAEVYHLRSALDYILDLLYLVQKRYSRQPATFEYDDSKQSHNRMTWKVGIGARLRYMIFYFNLLSFIRARKHNLDILHVHTIEWPAYLGAKLSRKFRIPLLVKDSTMNGLDNIERYPSGVKKRSLIIEQAYFVAMTSAIYNSFETHQVQPEKIFRIPNGIQIDNEYKEKYDGGNSVLFVGNLYQQPAKGVDILLKAWITIQQELPMASLYVVGDGDIAAYQKHVKNLGIEATVHFTGKTSDVRTRLLRADVFVLPSRREGMPNALMEAMMCGLPCVATDISGCQDLISTGDNGLLVPPADVEALAQALLKVLRDRGLQQRLGRAARETIKARYDINNTADSYMEAYKTIRTRSGKS